MSTEPQPPESQSELPQPSIEPVTSEPPTTHPDASPESQSTTQPTTQPIAESQPQSQRQPQPVTQPATQPKSKPAAATAESRGRGQALLQMTRQLLGIVTTAVPLVLNLLIKVLKWVWTTWNAVLPRIRALLPEPWKTRLPNQVFTAIALLLLLLILSVPSWLAPDEPAEIARTDEPALPVESPKSPSVDAAKLAKIQDQLIAVTDPYAVGLVQSVDASSRDRLQVIVNDSWYTLPPDQQDKLANDVLKRSHKLKFDRLELTDAEGVLLARSPVVGASMLVLERVKLLEADRV
ncbi:hypothetical protein IFO70_06280 [Phormidium tenue FACHB-886]|nr:hypothetical protein [Phormidium tenue FACHB-886]